MQAVAISMKTESGDDHLYLFTGGETKERIIEEIREEADEEFRYLNLVLIESSVSGKFEDALGEALCDAIADDH